MNYIETQKMRKQAWSLFGKPTVQKQTINTYTDANAKRIRNIIAQQLALKGDEVYDSQTWDDLNADELDRIEAIMALEENFNRMHPDEAYEKANTIGDMVALFRNQKAVAPSEPKLNKAQEAVMANAGKYKNSNELLKALEEAEDDSDLLNDLAAGARKMGYDTVIKHASYEAFKKQAEESVVSEEDYLKQLQKGIAQWRKSRELGTYGAFKSSIPISLLVAGIAGTAGTVLTGNIGAGAALGGISGVVTSAMNTINNRHALPSEASTSFFAAF